MPEQQTRLLAARYELIAPIGRGTMGTVWRAHDRLLGRDVAIKEIRHDPGLSEEQRDELRKRMIREGRAAAKIAHPSVATVHDAIVVDDSPWIIMELVEARSLEQVIDEEGPLPPRLVAEIGIDLLGALAAAHEQGILHRDVKPGNVLLTETGRVVLTDFGIAKSEGDSNITKTGMVIGSPGYTAPERARGDHTGPESDLWSLGATLYYAVEGRPAYERRSISETLAALMTEQADPARQAGPLRPALEALLEKDHTKRLSHEDAVAMLRTVARTPAGQMPPASASPDATPSTRSAAPGPAPSVPRTKKPVGTGPPPAPKPPKSPTGGSAGNTGAQAADRSADRPTGRTGTGPGPEVDTDRTMVVIRPKGGLRIPGLPPAAPPITAGPIAPPPGESGESGEPAGEDDQATMVGLIPPIPAAPPPASPAASIPPPPPAAPTARPAGMDRSRAEPASESTQVVRTPSTAAASAAAAPPRPGMPPGTAIPPGTARTAGAATPPAPPVDPGRTGTGPGTPEDSLSADLFALQGTVPPRGGSPAGMIVLVAIALLGLAAIVMLAAAALSGGSGSRRAGGAKTTAGLSAGQLTTASALDAADAVAEPGAAPAQGLKRYADTTGYVIDLPAALRGVAKGRGTGFHAEGDARTVRVTHSETSTPDVLATVKAAERRALAAGAYPGYTRLRLGMTRPAPYPGTDVADWEYTYTGSSGTTHVLARWIAVPGGSTYTISWSTPQSRWQAHRSQLGTVLSSFRPAREGAPGGS